MSVVPAQPRHNSAVVACAGGAPPPQSILALDLGGTTGWALRSADGAITSGTAEFRLDRWQSGGMRFLRFKRWLTEIKHQAGGIETVVYEHVRRHAGIDASHAFGGWLAILTAWCDHHGIAYAREQADPLEACASVQGLSGRQGFPVLHEEDLDAFFLDDGHDFFERGGVGCKCLRPNRAAATFIFYFKQPVTFVISTIDKNFDRGSVALDASAQRRVNNSGIVFHGDA